VSVITTITLAGEIHVYACPRCRASSSTAVKVIPGFTVSCECGWVAICETTADGRVRLRENFEMPAGVSRVGAWT
jgi:hypothetical protein